MFFVHVVIYVCCALSLSLSTCARIYVKSEKRERKERKAQ